MLIRSGTARRETGDGVCGPYTADLLSDTGNLTQFGAFIETLPVGSASSILHWHSAEDEMMHLLTGTVTLVEGATETVMQPGDTACFKAGTAVGHCLRNDGAAAASYLVIGTRSGDDMVTYPLTAETVTIRDGLKTYRDASGTVTKTAPYHGA
ncbi:cupin domain-containing protein [Loktanella sp. M215]|uniref:cupin domain-containing protein n=1 Tax=Loktanella sp. M215 TaxID=2675431 RepID=UPI001F171434|nr:cupin domain-containing protein [Loktanella sp. M215]MCF7697749.1 cupin domain-containing protein [Loktanella sp. M215]